MMIETRQYLKQHQIKPTIQRIAIMDYLFEHHTHPSVDEIFSALAPNIPTLSKSTVYNTLKLFVENGAARMIGIEEKNVRFDYNTSLHAHFYCLGCGAIHDIMPEELPQVTSVGLDRIGGKSVVDTELYYKGYCEKCAKVEE